MNEASHDRDPASGDQLAAKARKNPVLVAVDLGAESCRVSLLRWIDGQPEIRLVHRFANSARDEGNGLRWDIAAIVAGVEEGLRACAQLAPEGIAAIGVDGWAVDYVRLGRGDSPSRILFVIATNAPWNRKSRCTRRISPDRLYRIDRDSDPRIEHAVSVAR